MALDKVSFENIEEVGFRVKAHRLANGMTVSSAHGDTMTASAYQRAEDGKGSFTNLLLVCEKMGINVEVSAVDKNGTKLQVPSFADLHQFLIDYRTENRNRNSVAVAMGSPYASVIVFEETERPQVVSMGRYAAALQLTLVFTVTDSDGRVIIPSSILDERTYDRLSNELENALQNFESVLGPKIGEEIRAIRESKTLSRSKISKTSGIHQLQIQLVEEGRSSLTVADKMVSALGLKLQLYVNGRKVEIDKLTEVLDNIREKNKMTYSDLARKVGTTFRAIAIFRETKQPHLKNIERFAKGVGAKLDYRIY